MEVDRVSMRDNLLLSVSTTSDYTVRDQRRMTKATRYFAWQSRMASVELGRRVLEVGCGLGNFTEYLKEHELVVGIDVDEQCVDLHRRRFASSKNVVSKVLSATDESFLELKRHRPDSIVCLNVLEHIEDDRLTLEHFREVLPPGGKVVLIVPAFPALYGPIDGLLGHYRRYTRTSLAATAEAAGLRATKLRFMNTVGFFGWWVNAKVLKRTEHSEEQIALFDRYIVPAMSRAETLFPPPFGQSLFAVLERNA